VFFTNFSGNNYVALHNIYNKCKNYPHAFLCSIATYNKSQTIIGSNKFIDVELWVSSDSVSIINCWQDGNRKAIFRTRGKTTESGLGIDRWVGFCTVENTTVSEIQEGKKNGEELDWYLDRILINHYKDDYLDGSTDTYDKNGILRVCGEYLATKLNSPKIDTLSISHPDTGEMVTRIIKEEYSSSKIGIWLYFDKNGLLIRQEEY